MLFCWVKFSVIIEPNFREMIGSTHGIKFNKKPPTKEINIKIIISSKKEKNEFIFCLVWISFIFFSKLTLSDTKVNFINSSSRIFIFSFNLGSKILFPLLIGLPKFIPFSFSTKTS